MPLLLVQLELDEEQRQDKDVNKRNYGDVKFYRLFIVVIAQFVDCRMYVERVGERKCL